MKKKILYISSAENIFGAERRLIDIVGQLDKYDFYPVVLVPQEGPLSERLEKEGIETVVLDFKFKVLPVNFLRFFQLTRQFLRILKTREIQLIHINLHYYTSNFWLAFLISRIPVIAHVRSPLWFHIFERFVMSFYSRIIFVSEAVKKIFVQKRRSDFFIRFDPNRLIVLYNGVRVEKFQLKGGYKSFREEFGIIDEDKVVILVGAIDPVKGQDLFIEAANSILKQYANTKFFIIGELYTDKDDKLDYDRKLKEMISKYGLENHVYFTGYRSDVPKILQETDILVQPSEHEALGGCMIEAMASGTPAIGSNVQGTPEIIGNNEAGIVMKERDADHLTQAILFLLDNPDEAEKKGKNGKARAERLFNFEKNVDRLISIYQDVLGGENGSADC